MVADYAKRRIKAAKRLSQSAMSQEISIHIFFYLKVICLFSTIPFQPASSWLSHIPV